MTSIVRRIVSGPKARHVDKDLHVDLDLVYVTDRLIIMGWPGANFETLYRNSRKSVRRFLDAKHGEKYRVYNLCPCSENSYEANEFYGAVSRYPFPDHHPPPLSMIPMFVCDITSWLAEDPENVAIIHCKAGKGRSGTMACCYLLSLPILPPPPQEEANQGEQYAPIASPESRASDEPSPEPLKLESKLETVVEGRPSLTVPARHSSISDRSRPLSTSSSDLGQHVATSIERSRKSLNGVDPVRLGNVLAEHPAVQAREQTQPKIIVDAAESQQGQQDAQRAGAVTAAVGDLKEAYTADALAGRLRAVFELHTARRLKPPRIKAPSANASSASSSVKSKSRSQLPFLQEDPAEQEGSRSRSVSPNTSRMARSRSVSNLIRKASNGLLRNSPTKQQENNAAISGQSSASQSGSSTPYSSPPRRSGARFQSLRAGQASRADLSALGVNPMGKSTNDLPAKIETPTVSPLSSAKRPYGALVSGYASTCSIANARTESANGDTPHTDGMLTPVGQEARRDYFFDAHEDSPASQTLAPPLFQPGEIVPTVSDPRHLLSPYGQDQGVSASQLSLGGPSAEDVDFDDDVDILDEDEEAPRLAVSIPSQRRFVGYWARVLADMDPRAPLVYPTSAASHRTIRITRIVVDRRVSMTRKASKEVAENDGGKATGGAMSIQIGRYDPDLEQRLHAWEIGARRRTRAFGVVDPSAPTPDLPPSDLPEHGTDFRGPLRREQEREAEEKQWLHVERQNAEGKSGYERKLAQHGNLRGVGCWGINVLAERDRVRNFSWSASGREDLKTTKDKQKEAWKRETEIDYFATVQESDRKVVRHAGGNQSISRLNLPNDDDAGADNNKEEAVIVRHEYALERDRNIRFGAPTMPTWLKSAWTSRPSMDTTDSPSKAIPATTRQQSTNAACGYYGSSSTDTSPSGSSMWAQAMHDPVSGPVRTTPPTSVESLSQQQEKGAAKAAAEQVRNSSYVESRAQLAGNDGLVVNADHALQIKMLVGRSGASHARLPDLASCGYIWFIPSFETPNGHCVRGQRIRRTFTAQEIDFRKGKRVAKYLGGEIRRVTIEWEWIETSQADWSDEEQSQDNDATAVLTSS